MELDLQSLFGQHEYGARNYRPSFRENQAQNARFQ
jgi:hypothetical protein